MTHILNGDATAYVFSQAGIPGQVIVWREALAAGPVSGLTQGSKTDFSRRREWVMQQWGATEQDYISKVEAEFRRIISLDDDEEIILWFETDLFCQVNLMFLLNRIYNCHPFRTKLFLVCPTAVPGRPDFKGFGELRPEELYHLWQTECRALSPETIRQYAMAWDEYQSADAGRLISSLKETSVYTDPILRASLEAHIANFPSPVTGLNVAETYLLSLLEEGFTAEEAMHKFLAQDRVYGWGDVQVMDMIRPLEERLRGGKGEW